MYDFSFSQKTAVSENNPFTQVIHVNAVSIAHTNWEEHCVECSPPSCYQSCEIYLERADKRCVRMLRGIQKVNSIDGPLGFGIKCIFRKWAKLETIFTGVPVSIDQEKVLDSKYEKWGNVVVPISKFTRTTSFKFGPYSIFDGVRRKLFLSKVKGKIVEFDFFLVNCYLKDKNNVPLLVQIEKDEILYSQIHTLNAGENIIKIPVKDILKVGARVFVSPLEETETTIYFRWLDFVIEGTQLGRVEQPAPKVKVVAWDLDNTLWKGTLVNDTNVQLNESAFFVVKELDRRGILNTICSKNEEELAMAKLKELGIEEYFLYPAINWGQKSENLKAIATRLNLGIDSFAFIDDNIREREEIAHALPMVRIYPDTEVSKILSKEEFDIAVTETSKNRRQLYLESIKRETLKANFNDNYDDFLRSLEMVLTVEAISEVNKSRCYELLSRSNQLNLSTNRYTEKEYDALVSSPDKLCCAFRVSDKFGDYGIVSFLSLEIKEREAHLTDLVISCRIAKKKIENAILRSLKDKLISLGIQSISANLVITKKNGPLMDVFEELPFNIKKEDDKYILYELDNLSELSEESIITIR
jgi:FkbH-like protein